MAVAQLRGVKPRMQAEERDRWVCPTTESLRSIPSMSVISTPSSVSTGFTGIDRPRFSGGLKKESDFEELAVRRAAAEHISKCLRSSRVEAWQSPVSQMVIREELQPPPRVVQDTWEDGSQGQVCQRTIENDKLHEEMWQRRIALFFDRYEHWPSALVQRSPEVEALLSKVNDEEQERASSLTKSFDGAPGAAGQSPVVLVEQKQQITAKACVSARAFAITGLFMALLLHFLLAQA